MNKRLTLALSLILIAVVAVSAFVATEKYYLTSETAKKPFYVGVTYCGGSVAEAEQLIDKVKGYTNLFVLDSGSLMNDSAALNQICGYAVDSGLNVMVFFAENVPSVDLASFVKTAQAQWGSHFLGVYFDDEPGGKMLDYTVNLYVGDERITKQAVGASIMVNYANSSGLEFREFNPSGEVTSTIASSINETIGGVANVDVETTLSLDYLTNGTITCNNATTLIYPDKTSTDIVRVLIYEPDGSVHADKSMQSIMTTFANGSYTFTQNLPPLADPGNISQFEPYQQVWDSNPLKTYADAAKDFEASWQQTLDTARNGTDVKLFTSDYGLDWFDYKGGYDVVLGELGWNQSTTQNIAEVRGAADMQGKHWGTMITWQSFNAPYLQSGNQIYDEMKQSYESGATYVVVFNYASNSANGLLQDEQYSAIQRFWNDVVQNPKETNNAKGEDALVLPADYGWGMRNPTDNIWGVWPADNHSQVVWDALQLSLTKYEAKLDIVYDDPAYPVPARYQHVVYWNQTA